MNNNVSLNLSAFIENIQKCALIILFLTMGAGCSSLNDNLAEKPINIEQPVKGPYEIAAEENVPSVVSYGSVVEHCCHPYAATNISCLLSFALLSLNQAR